MRVIDFFDRSASSFPERLAFADSRTSYTYASMKETSERLAVAILARRLGDAARIAIYSPNCAVAFACVLGTLRAGATWVPINARNTLDANSEFMQLAQCEGLFYHSSFREQAEALRRQVETIGLSVCLDASDGETPSLEQFLAGTEGRSAPEVEHDPHRMTMVLGTGGTTGRSKGVMWDNLTWETLITQTCLNIPPAADGRAPVHLCVAPMTHAAGIMCFMLQPLAPTNIVLEKVDPLEIMRAIERHRVTHLYLPPTVLYAMLAHPQVRQFDYASLTHFMIAAAPVSPDKLAEAVDVFGPCMCQYYGQVEAPMVVTFFAPEDVSEAARNPEHRHRLLSCGRGNLLTRIAIMDEEGHLLPPGECGEIVVQGNLVAPGYYRNAKATAEARSFGWHHTGDIAYMDKEGFYYIVDRKKDMIISGGFNVFSSEVEAAINGHPAVENCAVIGVPDSKWGEAVKAIVVLKAGAHADEQEIIELAKSRLGGVKAPKSVEFWKELPRSAVGKVQKSEIRARYWAGRQRAVH